MSENIATGSTAAKPHTPTSTGLSPKSPLAEACLKNIEDIRRDYGTIDTEPRHPDVASGMAWPIEETQLPDRTALEGIGGKIAVRLVGTPVRR